MALKIPERRIRDIIVSSIRARQLTNEECFEQALELISFAEQVAILRKH